MHFGLTFFPTDGSMRPDAFAWPKPIEKPHPPVPALGDDAVQGILDTYAKLAG